jgi:transcriptional antiterminator RfaH
MRQWFVVQSNPREEERALQHLKEKGVQTFFPKIKTIRYRDTRAQMVLRPMFPGYLFSRFRAPDEIPHVLWTRGVRRILGAGDKPIAVEDALVNFITSQVDEDGVARAGRRLRPKDGTRIGSGPFKDLIKIFERVIDDRGRGQILLNLIGYQAQMQIHESLLENIPLFGKSIQNLLTSVL